MPISWWYLIKSGSRRWYGLVFFSFAAGILNPFVILGFILGLHVKNGYSGGIGLALTAISYLVSLAGFALAERAAYLDGNVRGLELASILALPIAFVAFLAGMAAPPVLMWPLAVAILLVSVAGLRAANSLVSEAPHPERGHPQSTATPILSHQPIRPAAVSVDKRKRERRRTPVRRRSR